MAERCLTLPNRAVGALCGLVRLCLLSNLLHVENLAGDRTDAVPDAGLKGHVTARTYLAASVVKAVIPRIAVHEIKGVTFVQITEDSLDVMKT